MGVSHGGHSTKSGIARKIFNEVILTSQVVFLNIKCYSHDAAFDDRFILERISSSALYISCQNHLSRFRANRTVQTFTMLCTRIRMCCHADRVGQNPNSLSSHSSAVKAKPRRAASRVAG